MKDKGMKGCTLNAPAEEEVLDLINVTMQQCRNALLPVKLLHSKLHLRKVQKYWHQNIPIVKKVNMLIMQSAHFRIMSIKLLLNYAASNTYIYYTHALLFKLLGSL